MRSIQFKCSKCGFETNVIGEKHVCPMTNDMTKPDLDKLLSEMPVDLIHISRRDANDDLYKVTFVNIDDFDRVVSALKKAIEALEVVDSEWCKHPSVNFDNDRHRDWCSSCSNWIYKSERYSNPAKEALTELESILREVTSDSKSTTSV